MTTNSHIKFYTILLFEFIAFPFFYMVNFILNTISSKTYKIHGKIRKPIEDSKIYVNIHEWGGYALERKKKVSNIPEFRCGLKYQLERFNREKENLLLNINVTISEIEKYGDINYVKNLADNIDSVPNEGMDFSGYAFFYDKMKDQKNAYIIFTNSSVNALQENFLKGHIEYMEEHPEVGMLGVSYCSKVIQTFARNNFTPHLQSFYLLTTIDVLKEIVTLNGGFPGKGIDHKLLLIREGEINLSSLVLDLKYNLALALEDGAVYKFTKNDFLDNSYNAWKLHFGDVRTISKSPNRINPIL